MAAPATPGSPTGGSSAARRSPSPPASSPKCEGRRVYGLPPAFTAPASQAGHTERPHHAHHLHLPHRSGRGHSGPFG
ncbi:hypothetical protein H9Y04_23060 [Streptomyces sp. TRM66268-LWL]|uniref:Uncharacterized protein n=1 Tax=Streptomyces polyasparticus TaxID=2767826 RepID=A0ABR7SKP4_9ACTN|nr:hypothetical protein [Streptomyces polyasparticus]MBC9715434.1 hypothetical protein [Streptomyces polyasparticus]